MPHGQGTYTNLDGSKFVGEFKNGQRYVQGIGNYPDGSSYQWESKDG